MKKENLNDISSEGFIYKHKSGAKLIFVKNDDDNRVFSVTFKTLPQNNKGTAHIMEHSVLCGSKKYPVKDPFNELEKGSLNTYLNAMTFEDKTMYPVGSTNEKDFINLMNVYLDAVFFPLIYDRKGIFLQEGHHCEKERINGVVYNEMRGVFSSPDRIIDFKVNEKLFENTEYRFYSGGVPEFIPELTYEEFLCFHKKYYHPANSIIYLYGDLDIKKYLEIIDRDYLSKFELRDFEIEYSVQEDFDEIKNLEIGYEVSNEEDKNYFECGAIIGNGEDFKLSFAFDILTEILLETEASPLKKALIENEIGNNVYGGFDDGMFQTAFSVTVEKTKCSDLEKFKRVYFNSLAEIVEKGLDKKLIDSCINRYKFYFKEEDFGYKPKGLFYNILIIKSFIYGEGNFDGVKFDELFEFVENVNFDELIKKYLLENKNYVFAIMKPENKKVIKNETFDDDLEFEEYKKIQDLEEDVKKIPVLDISDIEKKAKNIDILEDNIKGANIIYSKISDDDIVYLNLLFDTRMFDVEDLKFINILRYLFGKTDTQNYDYQKLANELNFYFGGFSARFESYGFDDDFLPVLSVNMKFLNGNLENVFKLIREVVFSSVFEKNRVIELLTKYKIIFERAFVNSGNIYAIYRGMSYLSEKERYSQKVNGIDFYEYLKTLVQNFDEMIFDLTENLKRVFENIFNRDALTIGLVCSEKNYALVCEKLEALYRDLPKCSAQKRIFKIDNQIVDEGFIIQSDVQYNALVSRLFGKEKKFDGRLLVLEKIIESDYLWNKIRLEGGAYGGSCGFNRRGFVYFTSFRDPNVFETFEAYKKIPEYLENLKLSDRELQKYIIGTVSRLDRPTKISEIMNLILNRTLSKITDEQRQKEREAVLSIGKSFLTGEAYELVQKSLSNSHICSFGNENSLKRTKKLFKIIKNI